MCGWNSTARDLIDELRGDDYKQKIVVLADLDKNPAGSGVYFVRGDATDAGDLERAGMTEASAALVFPVDGSDEADMHSILAIMAIKSIAPGVRTVSEVNNPRHEPHFHRAERGRAAGHVQGRFAPARALGAVPRPDRAGHGHRVGRRGLRALPRHAARRVPRAVHRHRLGPLCATSTRPRCCRSTAAGARS